MCMSATRLSQDGPAFTVTCHVLNHWIASKHIKTPALVFHACLAFSVASEARLQLVLTCIANSCQALPMLETLAGSTIITLHWLDLMVSLFIQ